MTIRHNNAGDLGCIEYRDAASGSVAAVADSRTLSGYAILYNSPTIIGDPADPWAWEETIAPGAADAAIGGDVRALVDHDTGRVIGRTKSKTLRLTSDATGILAEIDVPDTSDGNDLYTLVQRGDISSMSFGFVVTKQTWDETTTPAKRTIEEIQLMEVSAVAFPAFEDTTLTARSQEAVRGERKARAEDKRAADNLAAKRRLALSRRTAQHNQAIRGIRQEAP